MRKTKTAKHGAGKHKHDKDGAGKKEQERRSHSGKKRSREVGSGQESEESVESDRGLKKRRLEKDGLVTIHAPATIKRIEFKADF